MQRRSDIFTKIKSGEASDEVRAAGADHALPGLNRDDALLYCVSLGIMLLGIWGIWFALDNAPLGMLLIVGTVIGFLASLQMRHAREPFLGSLLALMAISGVILLLKFLGIEIVTWVMPFWQMAGDPTLVAVVGTGFIAAAASFFFVSRPALTFAVVPVLAIYGLLGPLLDPRVIIGFLLFLLGSVFLLSYENILSLKETAGLRMNRHEERRLPGSQLIISAGFFLIVVLIALVITAILSTTISRRSVMQLIETISKIGEQAPIPPLQPPASSALGSTGVNFPIGQGPITLGEGIVMHVEADYPELWRQRSYDVYTGNGWKVGEGPPLVRNRLDNGKAALVGFVQNPPTDRMLKQTFRLEGALNEGIPAAAQAQQVDFGAASGIGSLTVDHFGCLIKTGGMLRSGSTYRVTSMLTSLVTPAGRAVLDEAERERCLQIRWDARKVKDLVNEIVPANTEVTEKLTLLRGYLGSGDYRYTLQAKAVPPGEDAVSYFLFDSREGYCDLFASAFAIMCRAAGIPSRLAIGFAAGEPDDSGKTYTVRQSDGHAWVEVFLADHGWVAVDPTPPGQEEIAQKEAQTTTPRWKMALQRMRVSVIFFLLIALVSAALTKVLWFDPWWEQFKWEKRMCATRRGRVAVFYARMCRLLGRRGYLRQPSQTPLEYLTALSDSKATLGEALPRAEALTRLFVSIRYGNGPMEQDAVSAAEKIFLQLKRLSRKIKRASH